MNIVPRITNVSGKGVLRILSAISRSIAVNEVLSLKYVAQVALGRHATRVLTAGIRVNFVPRIKHVQMCYI